MDYIQLKSEIWDVNDDNGLTEFITEQDAESELCFTKVEKIRYENLVIFAKCKAILAPAPVQVSRLAPSTTQHITAGFKPNQDLKLYISSRIVP